jgi:hypothetical protein
VWICGVSLLGHCSWSNRRFTAPDIEPALLWILHDTIIKVDSVPDLVLSKLDQNRTKASIFGAFDPITCLVVEVLPPLFVIELPNCRWKLRRRYTYDTPVKVGVDLSVLFEREKVDDVGNIGKLDLDVRKLLNKLLFNGLVDSRFVRGVFVLLILPAPIVCRS